MTTQIPACILHLRLTPIEKLVLLGLFAHADYSTGRNAFPSIQRLSECTGYCGRTVQRALRSLEANGWIAVQTSANRYRPTTYALPMDRIRTEAARQDTEKRTARSGVTACQPCRPPADESFRQAELAGVTVSPSGVTACQPILRSTTKNVKETDARASAAPTRRPPEAKHVFAITKAVIDSGRVEDAGSLPECVKVEMLRQGWDYATHDQFNVALSQIEAQARRKRLEIPLLAISASPPGWGRFRDHACGADDGKRHQNATRTPPKHP